MSVGVEGVSVGVGGVCWGGRSVSVGVGGVCLLGWEECVCWGGRSVSVGVGGGCLFQWNGTVQTSNIIYTLSHTNTFDTSIFTCQHHSHTFLCFI